MFFRNYSTYEGEPARLYRSPDEIREDIIEIKRKIEAVNSRLNTRDVLSGIMDKCVDEDPEKWIPLLMKIADEAEESLSYLKSLKESLDLLGEELEDTLWAIRI